METSIHKTEQDFHSRFFSIIPSLTKENTWFIFRHNGDEVVVNFVNGKFSVTDDLISSESNFFIEIKRLYFLHFNK